MFFKRIQVAMPIGIVHRSTRQHQRPRWPLMLRSQCKKSRYQFFSIYQDNGETGVNTTVWDLKSPTRGSGYDTETYLSGCSYMAEVRMQKQNQYGCGFNNRYWVFYAATTDQEFTVTVTDLKTTQQVQYTNPLKNRADTVTDTSVFATCP
jgi:hypothetical protein